MSDDDDEFDNLDDFGLADEDAIRAAEQVERAINQGRKFAPISRVERPGLVQKDLFGRDVVQQPVASTSRTVTIAPPQGNARTTEAKVKRIKVWDRASFAKHGWSRKRAREVKSKARKNSAGGHGPNGDWDDEDEEHVLDDDDDDDEDDETLLDTSYDPSMPILPIKWPPDQEASKTWQYPVQADKPLRTYQYNIVHSCLFENTLVSLPTGLGKTFIAACVMLNFTRWYPSSTIIFLAPTRPLVTQQIKACHYIAGIPQSHCVELTGLTPPKLRAIAWASKKVVYCTPQTLENDLRKGRLDPRDISLVVVDEAHRASGDYAYVGVVRFIMSRNPHFRVLALTATPGSKGEKVQDVIDALHIGKIEVRTDESFDIRQYMHTKEYDLQIVQLGPTLTAIRDRWRKLMLPYHNPLVAARLVYERDTTMLSPYGVQLAYGKINGLPGGRQANGKFFPMVKILQAMARAMEYLLVESVTSFYNAMQDIEETGSKSLVTDPSFRSLLSDVGTLRKTPGYVGHPKMEKVREMCIAHFDKMAAEGEEEGTRVMVFCNFRAVVEEIVGVLNTMKPRVKATAFVGQASAKGVKGKSQKDQIETIKKFKQGVYNVLVATSIGEEGLDIGEIDLIINYEANKSPIRMLQRVGRTGRARDGHIIVFMTEGREEKNWDKAKDAYKEVQNALVSNKTFELYADGDRMLPAHIKPTVDKVSIQAEPLDLERMTMVGLDRFDRKTTAQEKKREKERKKQEMVDKIPRDAFLGFRTAGELEFEMKKARKGLSAEEMMKERKRKALLSVDEEADLRSKWMFAGEERVVSAPIDTSIIQLGKGELGPNLKIPTHGERHLDALRLFNTFSVIDDSKPEAFDKWHENMSAAFDPNLVIVWNPKGGDSRKRRKHASLRKRPPSPDPISSDPPVFTQHAGEQIASSSVPSTSHVLSPNLPTFRPPAASSRLEQFRRPPTPPSAENEVVHSTLPSAPVPLPVNSSPPTPPPAIAASRPSAHSSLSSTSTSRSSTSNELHPPHQLLRPGVVSAASMLRNPVPPSPPRSRFRSLTPDAEDDTMIFEDEDEEFEFELGGMTDSQMLEGARMVTKNDPGEQRILREADIFIEDSDGEL
ncbi:P-loop containing nucleoside triphosphate hydrolase protein [Meredithblackwellia eburnea MCA 4105]